MSAGHRGEAVASAASEPARLYPLFLKLEGRRCLVVGGGSIGAHKARDLLASGACVLAVSPAFSSDWDALRPFVEEGRLEIAPRPFAPGDARGAAVVVAATGEAGIDDLVLEDARREGALVNVVDVPDKCDFYTGAVVRRGPLQVVVGTSGASPALARRVRLLLEESLPEGMGLLAAALGRARPRILERHQAFHERARLLDAFVERALARLSPETTEADVARWIEDELLRGSPARPRSPEG